MLWADEVRVCGRRWLRHRGEREEVARRCGNVREVRGLYRGL